MRRLISLLSGLALAVVPSAGQVTTTAPASGSLLDGAAALPPICREFLLLWAHAERILAEEQASGISFQLFLTPPMDPWGEPWKVELEQDGGTRISPVVLESSPADPSGGWSSRKLSPAPYYVRIFDHLDNVRYSRSHELSPVSGPVSIQLEMVAVEGRVEMDSEPWQGSLLFGGQEAVSVAVATDEKGRFTVVLPRQGRWPLTAEFSDGSDIELDPVEIFQSEKGPVLLDLALPDFKIEGDVYLDGEKLAEASVMMRDPSRPAQGRLSGTVSDHDGHFVLRGRRAMEVLVTAVHPESKAEWLPVRLATDTPPIRLDLVRFRKLRGLVLGASGLPVADALVELRSGASSVLPWTDRANTSAEGRFELRQAPDAGTVEVLVYAPGFALFWRDLTGRIPVTGPLEIRLSPETGTLELQRVSRDLLAAVRLDGPGRTAPLSRWIEAVLPFGLFSTTSSGALRLAGLGTGPYSLCLAESCRVGILAVGEELSLSVMEGSP